MQSSTDMSLQEMSKHSCIASPISPWAPSPSLIMKSSADIVSAENLKAHLRQVFMRFDGRKQIPGCG